MNEYTYNDLTIGHKETFTHTVTIEEENAFRTITGDNNPLHRDDLFAKETGRGFSSHVTFGMMTASLYSTLAGMYLPGKYSLIHSLEDLKFLKPVYAGDTLTIIGEISEKEDGLSLIVLKCEIKNQENVRVSKAKMKVLVLK